MTVSRRRVLYPHFVRSMEHAREQFTAMVSERNYWRDTAREFEQALARAARELNRTRDERDAARESNAALVETYAEAREATDKLIRLYEQREQHWQSVEDRERIAPPQPRRLH